jgi:hypothetical protein
VLPVVIDDIKKSHPGHIGAFFKPLHTKSKAGRRRKATTAGRKRSHTETETSTAKKARISRETKNLHAEEERVASAEKKKRMPTTRTNYLKDKNMYDLLQSCIDGWDQKGDVEKAVKGAKKKHLK